MRAVLCDFPVDRYAEWRASIRVLERIIAASNADCDWRGCSKCFTSNLMHMYVCFNIIDSALREVC
jgi:hypothetical protein